ncbi:dimethylmenaquinone methyltransferase [Geomonas limicola]|uniref:Dimethylmenaquinone methyltransferase n=1 Tax=Geomonas limicola TaxID=2740186 RepID=A0A6V8N264_9BACT|nr:FAD-binding oxidoreductase [Geomonas limicola]GFO66511.1 dimethylmenaquinone methyltransferase [Geomonas limicola]
MSNHLEQRRYVEDKLNPGALEAELKQSVDGEVRFDAGSRALYATDASNYRQIPVGVVLPRSKDAVVKTLEICQRHGAPVVSRGGGTGLCGQTCNAAVLIDHSKYLNRVLEIDQQQSFARVEPGTILDDLRNQAERYHLTFGPDPATHNHNTLGGMLGNNSCGAHSVMAGRTVDNVLELEVVTYDGVQMTVGPTSERELEAIIKAGGRRGEIYQGLRQIRDRYADLIRTRYPRIPRRVSGYNLDELLPENGFNVAAALVGTEGTCITILEAKLRLVHSPPGRSILLLGYPDVFSAADHVTDILKFKPVALEGIDALLVNFIRTKSLHVEDLSLLPAGHGWLIVEFGGKDREESDLMARRAMEALRKLPDPPSMKLYDNQEEEKQIWELREQGLGATANVPGLPLSWPGWEDAAIAPEKLGGYLREFKKLLEAHGLTAALYGHFGDGCIHCRITFDLVTREGIDNFNRFLDQASDLVVRYGGSFSAEHGDGQSKAIFLDKMYGDELMQAMRDFKTLWDPEWKMNPGKVIDPYLPDQNLRLGTEYNPWQAQTHFHFPGDAGSFTAASLRCVGVGTCRRTHDAFMCPSFLASREEKHSTRGRARLIFEMFRGDFLTDRWHSKEVLEALEYCLSCKGCKKECPVNVDMATYKAEFLSHYYEGRLRPLPAYSMGLFGIWGDLGSRLPALANFLFQTPGVRDLVKLMGGIAAERQMPRFAGEPFTKSAAGRQAAEQQDPTVLLYPDVFNDCFYPDALKAALEALQRLGHQVAVLTPRPPAVRPPIDYGMLDFAKRQIVKSIELLSPFVRRGIPVVFLEPSEVAVFREELPNLMPHHLDGERVTKHGFLFSEFLMREGHQPPKLSGHVVLQSHCHQKAVLKGESTHKLLAAMGLQVVEPQTGCCGMAGSFGFEKHKYRMSQDIAEEALLPAVRKAEPETYLVADGFSCRTQITQATNRQVLHSAELVRLAWNGK